MKLLIVEDCQQLACRMKEGLELKGYEVDVCFRWNQAINEIRKVYDAYFVDLQLPDGSGFDLVRQIKSLSDNPVFIISSNCQEESIIKGYGLDVEEYIEKPIRLPVLTAKLESVLRRTAPVTEIQSGPVCLNVQNLVLTVGQTKTNLSKVQCAILKTLIENEGSYMSREKLLNAIFSFSQKRISDASLSVRISEIKAMLHDYGSCLSSKRNLGYVWMRPDDEKE